MDGRQKDNNLIENLKKFSKSCNVKSEFIKKKTNSNYIKKSKKTNKIIQIATINKINPKKSLFF